MFCPKCGKEIADGSAFCSFCGSRVEAQKENAAPAQKIDGSFMQCLETIMEIEERKAVQEKTMAELEEKIEPLGIPNNYAKPVERLVEDEEVLTFDELSAEYDAKYKKTEYKESFVFMLCGAVYGVIVWALGVTVWGLSEGRFNWIICTILGALISYVIAVFVLRSQNKRIIAMNDTKRETAQKAAHNEYLTAYQQYQDDVAADQERVIAENSQKRVLQNLKEQLKQRHSETESHLTNYYNASGLYKDYTNFVAVSHIYEYLKSGICSKLGGTDGAYMVFKYEMHEKHKEERLDLIGSKIDQLHFDCMTLNSSLGQIAGQVSRLADSVDDFRLAYQDAASRENGMFSQLGDRLSSFEESYARNSAISQYNQECIEAELNEANWLEVYKLMVNK